MEVGLSAVEQFKLGLSSTYYSVARALRLRKLKDLLQSAQIATDAAVWLLGECYGDTSEGAMQEEVRLKQKRGYSSRGATRDH
jgi:hypothetical protein